MQANKDMLSQTMAFLISVPPDSNLKKLLAFCLATKARENTLRTEIVKLTSDLMENPSNLAYWTQEVMGLDLDYSTEEWKTLGEMGIKDARDFMNTLFKELGNLNL
ncbi:MAG TPA: hypothetical protein DEG17_00230 [Cyanobacteria bacterium UBA11149]|nr:hypothetical protein [Cyanobacteria bacterium UBA11367]HBE59650.1 hypothetical protein [Cyanobacteria bacterium UBA11366]HBK66165.1 hypothetical protein [Cyanobacteria bacterium UBA11166]HBR75833.1 hypothetical protein [Cyanobacteria bacterium UBA11159]HBS72560.1 hypothetical protein [Cyanobacteria bacterium UBA11153]HBW87348.1 hypothetical protein [Cyanobacteria bacterium UBA11149]HCA97566.1 hypothetical protein [Cyanobacteria bacterium UBA9226]